MFDPPDTVYYYGWVLHTPGWDDGATETNDGEPNPYYSVNFVCDDGHIENLWVEEAKLQAMISSASRSDAERNRSTGERR